MGNMTTEQVELSQVLQKIQAKRESAAAILESNIVRTKRLWRRASHQEWEYKGDFIRGKFEFAESLPHVFEGTCPKYLMGNAELSRHGLKPGQAERIAHTYNQQASCYYLYDVRDCEPIKHQKAKDRLEKAIGEIENALDKGYPGNGREILLQVLREHRDIPF